MKVKVTTWSHGHYLFTQDKDGKWLLYRHGRSYYTPLEVVHICILCRMYFEANKLNSFTKKVEYNTQIRSSTVKKILVDGKPVTNFTIE